MSAEYFLTIFRLLATNYPVITNWISNVDVNAIIIKTDEAQLKNIVNRFPKNVVLGEDMDGKTFRSEIKAVNSKAVLYILRGDFSNYNNKNRISQLDELTRKDIGYAAAAFIIYVGTQPLPEKLLNSHLVININEIEREPKVDVDDMRPDASSLSLVKEKAEELGQQTEDLLEKMLYAAVAFSYPKLKEQRREVFDALVHQVPEILNSSVDLYAEDYYTELAVEKICDSVQKRELFPIYELPNLEAEAVNKLNAAGYIRGKFLYLSDDKFHEILRPILYEIPYVTLKSLLSSRGILIKERTSYTKRMRYFTAIGQEKYIRMITLDITKIKTKDVELIHIL